MSRPWRVLLWVSSGCCAVLMDVWSKRAGAAANEAAGAHSAGRGDVGAGGGPDPVDTVRALASVLGVAVEGSDPVTMLQVRADRLCTGHLRRECAASVQCALHKHRQPWSRAEPMLCGPRVQVVLRDVRKRVAAQRAGETGGGGGGSDAALMRRSAFPAGLETGSTLPPPLPVLMCRGNRVPAWRECAVALVSRVHTCPPRARVRRVSSERCRCSNVSAAHALRSRPAGAARPSKRTTHAAAGPYSEPKDRQPTGQGRAIAAPRAVDVPRQRPRTALPHH